LWQSQLNELDSLTGNPLPDDVLLFAIPVCAPYSALNNFKYKVKLTPGSGKKGKAIKSAMSYLLNSTGALPQEKELMKGVGDNELNQTVIGNIKVNIPLKHAMKQKKKGK
jgi:hypothetical protein